ncbi:methyl-accepting chemotaxis protein [Oricola indica]|uniref:methyl-accepting chemotaxis protein n=1 Tax=Oricola indica TaxID=2872591 RepID=UPI003CCC4354
MGNPANSATRGRAPAKSRWNLSNGLKLFAVVIAVNFLVLLAVSDYRQNRTSIGSAAYDSITVVKDLIADILPPSSYIVEAFLTIVQASQEPWNRDRYFAEYRTHKDAYFDQLQRWEKAKIPEHIRKLITVDSPTVLDRFWIEAENNFFPKLENSGGIGLGAAEIKQSLDILKERFLQHKAIMVRASEDAETYLASVERDSKADMAAFGWVFHAAFGVALLMIGGFLIALHRTVVRPLVNIAGYTADLAHGESDEEVPYTHRGDEVGSIAKALTIFRETAAEKLETERQAAMDRQRADNIKAQSDAELADRAEQTNIAVSALAEALSRLSEGDLDCDIEEPFDGELERLRVDFNMALGKISGTFEKIAMTATGIESGSQEIFTASNDLSRRTEQQAASLQEAATTLEQITATVQKSSEGAESSMKLVNTAREDAEASGGIVTKALEAMADIEKSATEISQIISVIDEIAFQTNLLALNAGVEAARAGDAGRGFAVVAQEVRELAQRSAAAAKEIKQLIFKSSGQVATGSELVNKTGDTLHRIAGQVVEISGAVEVIANGAIEQSVALKQLNVSVGEMDEVTQQNAAMAEQASAASHSLTEEIEHLAQLISVFRVSEQIAPREPYRAHRETRHVRSADRSPQRAPAAYRGRTVGNAALKDEWGEF